MMPAFFGPTGRPLFGVYHAPETAAPHHAALLSAPVGHEYVRTHSVYRNLAIALCRAGVPTLRFDYTGTGDSTGDPEEGNLEVWRQDITTAAEELRDLSGCRELSVVGARMGATVAATWDRFPCPMRSLILWDPVVVGAEYLDELVRTHHQWLGLPPSDADPTELVGSAISEQYLAELKHLDLCEAPPAVDATLILAVSEDLPQYRRLHERVDELEVSGEIHVVADAYDWHDPFKVESIVTAPNMTKMLVERLGDG